MTFTTEGAERATTALRAIERDRLPVVSDGELLDGMAEIEALGRQLDVLRVEFASEVQKRSDPALGDRGLGRRHGCRIATHLIERVTGVSAATARQRVRLGSRVLKRLSPVGIPLPPAFPMTGEAFADGSLGVDQADALTHELDKASARATVEGLDIAERVLIEEATGAVSGMTLSADLVRHQARAMRDVLDPDGIEPRADEAFAARDFTVSRTLRHGVHSVSGGITPEAAAYWFELMNAVMTPKSAPKFVPAELPEPGEVGEVPEARSSAQQGHDLFVTLVAHFASTTDELSSSGAAPTVIVTVSGDDLANGRGVGTMTGISEPVPMSTVKQHLCNGVIQRAVLGPMGEIVSLEHRRRLFSRQQRLAMIARDGPTCLIPGCGIPATACEAHHVTEWHRHQHTSVENGVLVCYAHHRAIEHGTIEVEFIRGRPRVTLAHGSIRAPRGALARWA